MENILRFLAELKQNNNRDWFQANKEWYLEAKQEHEALVGKIITGISTFDSDMQLLSPKECVFRIYRDVRFSKNKDPYKTAMGAVFSKGGRKSKFASYYLHLEPGNSFAGGGIWCPESEALKNVRYEIYNYPNEFLRILNEKKFREIFGEMNGEKLKRPPKDFPNDFDHIDLLKFKSFIVGRQLRDDVLLGESFLPDLLIIFKTLKPFIRFLNRGIENE